MTSREVRNNLDISAKYWQKLTDAEKAVALAAEARFKAWCVEMDVDLDGSHAYVSDAAVMAAVDTYRLTMELLTVRSP